MKVTLFSATVPTFSAPIDVLSDVTKVVVFAHSLKTLAGFGGLDRDRLFIVRGAREREVELGVLCASLLRSQPTDVEALGTCLSTCLPTGLEVLSDLAREYDKRAFNFTMMDEMDRQIAFARECDLRTPGQLLVAARYYLQSVNFIRHGTFLRDIVELKQDTFLEPFVDEMLAIDDELEFPVISREHFIAACMVLREAKMDMSRIGRTIGPPTLKRATVESALIDMRISVVEPMLGEGERLSSL